MMAKPILIPFGLSNVKIALLISDFSGLKINHQNVSSYRRKDYKFLCLKKRRAITKYFILQGYIPIPKPRKIPVCRNCGTQYPTRKLESFQSTFIGLAFDKVRHAIPILQFESPDKKVAQG